MARPVTVERVNFTVQYDGEALRDHQMSVRDLAPALLGLADVFQVAQEVLNPGEPPVTLDIRANAEGSFAVELAMVYHHVLDMLTSQESQGASALTGFVLTARGLFNFLRSRFRHGGTEEQLPDGSAKITFPDGTSLEFPAEVLLLSRQAAIRRGAQAVVAPLNREGVDEVELSTEDQLPPVVIQSHDLPAINAATGDEDRGPLVTNERYEQLLTISSLTFKQGNKWRMHDGQNVVWMAVDDPHFLAQIDRGEIAFRKNDRLRADVWLQQWATDSGDLHTERSIVRVIEYISRPEGVQEPLPDMPDSRPSDSA